MSGYTKYSDIRDELAEGISAEVLAEAAAELEAAEGGWKLAELRKRCGLTQQDVATRMDVSKARVSQIERGLVSTQEVVARYVEALGGRLQQTAHFPGGDVVVIARVSGSDADVAVPTTTRKRTSKVRKKLADA